MELWELKQKQSLPLEAKIAMTLRRIREWYEYWDGNVYVSFSGGKDSTVLLHLVRQYYPDVTAVFSDTGLEFPEIREFVKTVPNVTWLRPAITFKKVIEKHGYPVISKEQAQWIERARRGDPQVIREKLYGIRPDGSHSRFCTSAEWRRLFNAPFRISAECCNEMKKKPLKKYAHETGRVPIIGTMASESKLREKNWLKTGCNAFEAKRPVSMPMSFWLEKTRLRRWQISLINIVLLCVLALPTVFSEGIWNHVRLFGKTFMDLEDYTVSNLLLPVGSLLYVLFCTSRYGWGWKNYLTEVNTGDRGLKMPRWIRPYMSYVLPLIILAVLVLSVL